MEPEEIVERYDKAIAQIEERAVARLNAALEAAYQQIERNLKRTYPSISAQGSLAVASQAVLRLEQLKKLLLLVSPQNAQAIEQSFAEILELSQQSGLSMAELLIEARSRTSATLNTDLGVAAAAFAAQDAVVRLSRHAESFREQATSIVTQGIIQGWSTQQVATALRKALGLVKGRAETIARTEVLSAFNSATIATYRANGVQYVQLIGTQDKRTCSLCLTRNMNVYRLGDISAPLHPNCRCILMPWNPEWQRFGLTNDDWARDFYERSLKNTPVNNGPAPFEKYQGQPAPEPIWTARNGFI